MIKDCSKEITMILPLRVPPVFRDEGWVNKCLASLSNQSRVPRIVIVDYGSAEKQLRWIRPLVARYGALLEYNEDTDDWVSNTATNIAIRQTETKYIVTSNIDCYFEFNFIQEVLNVLRKGKYLVNCLRVNLGKNGKSTGYGPRADTGVCIGIETAWLKKVCGFDEMFKYWGGEDNDLCARAERAGFKRRWINNVTSVYSRCHVRSKNIRPGENLKYGAIKNKPIVRNPDGWGGVYYK